ncbi:arylamine N-acetyltransferase [Metabacillus sp. RGM 3146]|uniref:arylamine N-acetyltransferase n=1 Tax=Metabacillus sp. RGM 3146 TaxID=3401092 RepID=UPI003B9A4631
MDVKKLLLQRIGLSPNVPISLDNLPAILEAYAFHVPFENIDVIDDERMSLSRESLADKILIRKRGGLCYEMNPLMYWFLREAGIDAILVKATVYNNEANTWAQHHTHPPF